MEVAGILLDLKHFLPNINLGVFIMKMVLYLLEKNHSWLAKKVKTKKLLEK
jgi:hypothetical protein